MENLYQNSLWMKIFQKLEFKIDFTSGKLLKL